MQVVFHIGAHCTNEDRLLKSLLKNRDTLKPWGVTVPGPGRYRKLIRQTVKTLDGSKPTSETQEALLDAITDEDNIKRLILSSEDFLSFAPWVFINQTLYGNAEDRITGLSNLFPNAEIEFHLAIRNPATFIPAVYRCTKDLSFSVFTRGVAPIDAKWSTLIQTIRTANPDAKLSVWCNEDMPLIWSQVMHDLAGIDSMIPLEGETDLLADIMTKDGLDRYHKYLKTHPPKTEMQKRQMIATFLDKFSIPEKLESEIDLPDWTQQQVDELTELYDADLLEIEQIPGVSFIDP